MTYLEEGLMKSSWFLEEKCKNNDSITVGNRYLRKPIFGFLLDVNCGARTQHLLNERQSLYHIDHLTCLFAGGVGLMGYMSFVRMSVVVSL